jgi:thioesterase domain-containing protein
MDPGVGADLGWSAFTSEPVAIEEVPGDHITLLAEPNVAVLAARLRTALDGGRP